MNLVLLSYLESKESGLFYHSYLEALEPVLFFLS